MRLCSIFCVRYVKNLFLPILQQNNDFQGLNLLNKDHYFSYENK